MNINYDRKLTFIGFIEVDIYIPPHLYTFILIFVTPLQASKFRKTISFHLNYHPLYHSLAVVFHLCIVYCSSMSERDLYDASRDGDLTEAKRLLDAGADMNWRDGVSDILYYSFNMHCRD